MPKQPQVTPIRSMAFHGRHLPTLVWGRALVFLFQPHNPMCCTSRPKNGKDPEFPKAARNCTHPQTITCTHTQSHAAIHSCAHQGATAYEVHAKNCGEKCNKCANIADRTTVQPPFRNRVAQ